MIGSEERRVADILRDMEGGDQEGEALHWDPGRQTISSLRHGDPTGDGLKFGNEDMGYGGIDGASGSIVATGEQLDAAAATGKAASLPFRCLDDGDVYTAVNIRDSEPSVPGKVYFSACDEVSRTRAAIKDDECVQLFAQRSPAGGWTVRGFVRRGDQWVEVPVNILPLKEDLFCRTRGILDTAVLQDKRVFVLGQGTLGSHASVGLAQCGVGYQSTLDYDRLALENVARHPAGLSQVGRYKTRAVADLIRDKNPYACTKTYEQRITWETQNLVRELVRESDLVVCGADEPTARVIVNLLCVQEGKTLILAGARRRAHAGQVLIVRPHRTPCYQCYRMSGLGKPADSEVSSSEAAARLAYSDRPVAAEPGLSNDIAPITQMVVKLAIQELVAGTDTTLRSLDEDLSASWFLWINRREVGSEFEHLQPLAYNTNGIHVMRWYGIGLQRQPACPVCGDSVSAASWDSESLLAV